MLLRSLPSSSRLFHEIKAGISTPLLAPLMANRPTGWFIVGYGGLQTLLTAFHLPGWPCPFLQVTGIPCPGCGFSRAIVALLSGDWSTALTFHAFAPLLLLALALLAAAVLLPDRPRRWLIGWIERVENRTGLTAVLLVGLILYWLARLLFIPEVYINLIQG